MIVTDVIIYIGMVMENFIKKVESLQQKALSQIAKEERAPVTEKEQLRYIG